MRSLLPSPGRGRGWASNKKYNYDNKTAINIHGEP